MTISGSSGLATSKEIGSAVVCISFGDPQDSPLPHEHLLGQLQGLLHPHLTPAAPQTPHQEIRTAVPILTMHSPLCDHSSRRAQWIVGWSRLAPIGARPALANLCHLVYFSFQSRALCVPSLGTPPERAVT
jgi:hypothetical protein